MRVLDKKFKDYYDYISYLYGQPEKDITYERNGILLIDNDLLKWACYIYFERNSEVPSVPKTPFFIEIGYIQYFFGLRNVIQDKNKNLTGEIFLKKKFDNGVHIFENPITMWNDWRYVSKQNRLWWWDEKYHDGMQSINDLDIHWLQKNEKRDNAKHIFIKNPIFKDTQIPSLIPAQEIYVALHNYIAAKNNDKDIDLKMTDEEKTEIAGFDRKISFRNPIKL
jgi:hypothetical protein